MKDIENIEDWYRDELDNFNVNPDQDVWNSLSDELDANLTLTDDNISDWYKREVDKLEERPDYTVWEKLATKLDTASVWDRLVVSLNQYEKFIWWRNTILKGTAIILLLGGSYLAYQNYSSNSENIQVASEETNNTNKKQQLVNPINTNIKNKTTSTNTNKPTQATAASFYNNSTETKQNNTIQPNSLNKAITKAKQESNKSLKSNNNDRLIASNQNEIFYPSKNANDLSILTERNKETIFSEIDRRQITTDDISHTFSSADFLVKKEKNKIVFNSKRFSSYTSYGLYARRFYLGFNAGVKKQGLITNLKKDGLLANYTQVEYLDFGTNIGLTAGYILSDKINFESNINVISTSGYNRRYNGEANSYEENLNLNYTTINLLAKKMNTKSTFDNKVYSTNIIGGVYASFLNTASSKINGTNNDLESFNNTDLGIVLGVEQDRYLSKTLIITPGIRYNQGLTNIANEKSNFSSARNFSLEFNIGLKYIFLKTSK